MDYPPDIARLAEFITATDDSALALLNQFAGELLTGPAAAELARLAAAERDPQRQQLLQSRLELLQAAQEWQAQLASLAPHERLFLAFAAATSDGEMLALVSAAPADELDALEQYAEERAAAEPENAAAIHERLARLRELRNRLPELLAQATQALADLLVAWIQTPDWDASQQYLHEHASDLLTDAGEAALQLLLAANEGNEQIAMHINLLARCRELGIDAAYAELRGQMEAAAALRDNPLLRTVVAFLQAEDDAEAQALLDHERNLLLTADAGGLIEGFLATARREQDASNSVRFQRRYEVWQAAFLRGLGPLRGDRSAGEWSEQPQPTDQTRQQEQTPEADRSARYVVIGNHNMVVGEGATVVTITNVGELPLEWRRPEETEPRVAAEAVGRERELADLHRQLQQGQGGTIVAVGVGAALRGTAGIGKTVLAALYATRYAAQYAGGVLWLSLGPGVRSADEVTPELQRIAAYAYRADAQALQMLENTVFTAPAVRMLLNGHGPLLVVADDVWSEEVVRTVKAALPAGATLLLTTRDYDVAFALAESDAAIFALDVLSKEDARLLLQSKVNGLDATLADRLAQGLGYHALALTLAAAALSTRGEHRFRRTAEEILERVAAGRGFGHLPRLGKEDQETRVEEILKYSYDYLGEDERNPAAGAARQAWFRSLGVFAQEADFDTAAAAALWQQDETLAEECLLLLHGLALIHEPAPGRWQQHAILRAYARSLLVGEEQLAGEERHADYYLALARACYRAQPRDDDRVEIEFKQIEHAFAWCRARSPSRAVALTNVLNDFMRNRGRAPQLHGWLTTALSAADDTGDRLGKANTLQSLGDLERRLGNVAQARQHYDDALQLYELEQEPGGLINTCASLARLAAATGDLHAAGKWYRRALEIADDSGFAEHPVVQDLRSEYRALQAGGEPPAGPPAAAQALADMLVAWIQTPDWDASQQYLREHADEFVTDAGEAALKLLLEANPGHKQIELHIPLLARCRAVGIDAAYAEFHQATAINAAINALMAAASSPELEQALAAHSALLELPTLAHLAALTAAAAQGQQRQEALALLGRLLWLFEQYNFKHNTGIDPAQHEAFIALHDHLLPVATALGDAQLALHLRRSAGWACNTLGNHYAASPESTAQAIAAYTRGLDFDDANAMLLRNRAGEQIEAGDYDAARGDIERAAELEPGARRLPALWCELYATLGESAALQGHVARLLAQPAPAEGEADYRIDALVYQAVALTLEGAEAAALAALQQAVAQAGEQKRTEMRTTLERLARLHPAGGWAALLALFGEKEV